MLVYDNNYGKQSCVAALRSFVKTFPQLFIGNPKIIVANPKITAIIGAAESCL